MCTCKHILFWEELKDETVGTIRVEKLLVRVGKQDEKLQQMVEEIRNLNITKEHDYKIKMITGNETENR